MTTDGQMHLVPIYPLINVLNTLLKYNIIIKQIMILIIIPYNVIIHHSIYFLNYVSFHIFHYV